MTSRRRSPARTPAPTYRPADTRTVTTSPVAGVTLTRSGMTWTVEADGLDAFMRYVADAPSTGAITHAGGSRRAPDSWNGAVTWDGAVALARTGWAEGREHVARYTLAVEDVLGAAVRTDFESAVVGPIFDIGAFLADDPFCFLRPVETEERERSRGPIVRIVLNGTVNASASAQTIMRRGAAVVAVVNALEASGRRCEVIVTLASTRGGASCHVSVPVKRPDQNVSMDTLAFALAHPSMLRRFYFAVVEAAPADIARTLTSSYGGAAAHPLDKTGDITLSDAGSADWYNERTAAAAVRRILTAQGITMRDAA